MIRHVWHPHVQGLSCNVICFHFWCLSVVGLVRFQMFSALREASFVAFLFEATYSYLIQIPVSWCVCDMFARHVIYRIRHISSWLLSVVWNYWHRDASQAFWQHLHVCLSVMVIFIDLHSVLWLIARFQIWFIVLFVDAVPWIKYTIINAFICDFGCCFCIVYTPRFKTQIFELFVPQLRRHVYFYFLELQVCVFHSAWQVYCKWAFSLCLLFKCDVTVQPWTHAYIFSAQPKFVVIIHILWIMHEASG